MSDARATVFLGPSLAREEAQRLFPEAQFEPPARRGDVLRALNFGPRVIALIDGVFESSPSVWHQELRIALASGVHLLGASSMGALRAAELAPEGMIGIGEVFRAYLDGRLCDDADVALLHADAEHDHRPLTVPLVNVASQASAATEAGLLSSKQARALVEVARSIHYKDRDWNAVLGAAGISSELQRAFHDHRRAHPSDVKAADARECLVAARALLDAPAKPSRMPTSLSPWARQAWLEARGDDTSTDTINGLRTLLLSAWGAANGLEPPPQRVAELLGSGARSPLDLHHARQIALEETLLAQPSLLLSQAPTPLEARHLESLRSRARRLKRR